MTTIEIRRRVLSTQVQTDPALAQLSPLLRRIYGARGIYSGEQLQRGLHTLASPEQLKDIDAAVALLLRAFHCQQKILVIADYDADGATSCALMVKALRALGAEQIGYLVPNRFDYGYGLTPEIVALAACQAPQLIITVDNGIASVEGVQAANELGIPVLVTDHHLPPEKLPQAAAIVNPNQLGDCFAGKCLAGVGVAFYVLMALRSALRAENWFQTRQISEPNLAQFLDLVALGTVADLVPLDQMNRVLVHQGLQRIRADQACVGIQALIQVARRDPKNLQASDLGFALGPRLNAAGRLDDMSLGIECLLTSDLSTALSLASQLDELNRSRRHIESRMQQEAVKIVDEIALSNLPTGICLHQSGWHTGVVGIVASRVKERYTRPVIAFAAEDEQMMKGSGRSITGFHLRDALANINVRNPGLIDKFGGHAMAAGLTIRRSEFENFARVFNEEAERQLSRDQLHQIIESDGALTQQELNLAHAQLLQQAGPWGQAFPEPCFDGQFQVLQCQIVGEKHLKLKLRASANSPILNAIWFDGLESLPDKLVHAHIAYRLAVNDYLNTRSVQLIVEHLKPVPTVD